MKFDEATLRRAVKDLVRKATEEQTLGKVGKKTVLRYLRECGEFEPELLEDGNFKEKAVAIATPLLQAALDQQEEDSDIVSKSRAKKRKSQPDDSDEEMQDARPTKKARPPVSKKEKEKAEEDGTSMYDAEDVKPPPMKVTTSESRPTSAVDSKKQKPASPPKTPVNKKRAKKPRKRKPDSDEESEDERSLSTPPVLKNGSKVQENNAQSALNETLVGAAELSDGDLSVLDPASPEKEKPKSSRKKSDSSKAPKPKKERKASSSKGKDTGPDEEEIKKLKNYVVACGVRKQWKKEFEGIEDKPKKQIARLKEILVDLGMRGRLSLDKAKAIREKRELATELEEVVAFEAKRGARAEEKTEKSSRQEEKSTEEPHLSEEEQEAAQSQPRRKKNFLAFLDDQSDDE